MQRIQFEGSSEVGAYAKLTSTYAIVGTSHDSQFRKVLEDLVDIPIIETMINSTKTVGNQLQGNKYGLMVPMTTHDHELILLRQMLPESVRVRRIEERLNALGNVLLCNDHVAIAHPEIDEDSMETISHVLNVPVHKLGIGNKHLVGTYGAMNNQGLLVCPETSTKDQKELSETLMLRVVAGTVNTGKGFVGGGMVVNDWIGLCGRLTTNAEISVMEKVFMLKELEEQIF